MSTAVVEFVDQCQPDAPTPSVQHRSARGHNVSRLTKRALRQWCLDTLENKQATVAEQISAASILEKLLRMKDLGAARKSNLPRTKKGTEKGTVTKSVKLDDILRQVGE